jgi:hypothetical protein
LVWNLNLYTQIKQKREIIYNGGVDIGFFQRHGNKALNELLRQGIQENKIVLP